MDLFDKLNLALERCGYSTLEGPADSRQVGSGAWHDAYLVEPPGYDPLVIRLRKKVIYGHTERWDEQALQEDYAPVGLYYQEANQAWPGTCPAVYHYRIDPELIFTLESYIPGSALPLQDLSIWEATKIGESLGAFFRLMHQRPAPLPGNGLVTWGEGGLTAASSQPWTDLWLERREQSRKQLATLSASPHEFKRSILEQKLDTVLSERNHASEPIVLANQDITPENLLIQDKTWLGLVDPVPTLDNGAYYAAWFTHCYRLFLPALSDAPRYAHHDFKEQAKTLCAVAAGFEDRYTRDDTALRMALHMDEFLWTLDLAYESYQLLEAGLTPEMQLRRGDEANVEATLMLSLQNLEESKW